jgi:ABC-type polar amino acid transport system ATPase subunit
VPEGEVIGLLGFSGAGKSTLLRLINRLEEPSSGSVRVGGVDLVGLSQRDLRQARQQIGMIFQQFNLLSSRTALDNVDVLAGGGRRRCRARRASAHARHLAAVGLSDKEARAPRAALRRAEAAGRDRPGAGHQPAILLCDEATSALDPHTALSILRLLKQLNRERGMTMVMVTHDIKVASYLCEQSPWCWRRAAWWTASTWPIRRPRACWASSSSRPPRAGPTAPCCRRRMHERSDQGPGRIRARPVEGHTDTFLMVGVTMAGAVVLGHCRWACCCLSPADRAAPAAAC